MKQISIRRFRGIREVKEPIRLRKFNVLLGRNNSGKTAILEALSLLPHPRLEVPWLAPVICPRYKLLTDVLHGEGPLSILIYKYAGEAEVFYDLCAKLGSLRVKVRITRELVDLFIKKTHEYLALNEESTLREFRGHGLIGPETSQEKLSNTVAFIPSSDIFIHRLIKGIYDEFDLVEEAGAHNRVIREVVNKCVNEKFTEVVPIKNELRLRKEYPDGVSFHVRLEDVGDGLERAISVLLWLDVLRPKLILWDDFEANMHPSLVREVLRWLSNRDWQVVLATHSIDVLHRLVEIWPRDAQVILLHKTADDVLCASYKSLEELDRALTACQDPRYLPEWLGL